MKLKENQYRRIEKLLPKQRGNVKIANRVFLDAILYRCKNGCSWTQSGVFDWVYAALCEEGLQDVTEYGLDSTSVKVHPDAFGCLKKRQTGDREVARGLEY